MAESTEKKIRKFLQVGTIECMILCAVLAIVVGVLFITIGFWKTLLITVLILIGLFIGGVTNKKEFLRGGIDKVAPQRAAVEAKRDELVQRVRETVKREEADAVEEIEEKAEEAAEDVQENVDAAVEAAAEAQEAVEETVAEAQEEIEAKAEEISEAAEEIVAEAKETEEKIEEAAEEIGEKIKDAAEEAAE